MKLIQYYISKGKLLVLPLMLAMLFTSCDEDDNTGASELVATNPTITITGETNVTVTESDQEFVYTATLSTEQIVDVVVYINVLDGTATSGEDFELSDSKIVIPAYSTSASFSVKIKLDLDIYEETETFTLQFGDSRTANATISPITASFTINNVFGTPVEELEIVTTWGVSPFLTVDAATNEITELNKCDLVDIDLVTFRLNDEGGLDYVEQGGATGACPETNILDYGTLGDGTYFLVAYYYDGLTYAEFDPILYPLQVTASRYNDLEGTLAIAGSASYTQSDDEFYFTSNDTGDSAPYIVTYFEITGGNIKMFSQNDNEVGSFRLSAQQMIDMEAVKPLIWANKN